MHKNAVNLLDTTTTLLTRESTKKNPQFSYFVEPLVFLHILEDGPQPLRLLRASALVVQMTIVVSIINDNSASLSQQTLFKGDLQKWLTCYH